MLALQNIEFSTSSGVPLYRQLAGSIEQMILLGAIAHGDRLPATRELAGQLGLNRTTVSAAYSLLEQSGLLEGQVGRGSFVAYRLIPHSASSLDWDKLLTPLESTASALTQLPNSHQDVISFANSRPSEASFPLAAFRRLAKEVVDSPQAAGILQLGSPYGYEPLRQHLLSEAKHAGVARATDDLIVTNGCQQALDLIARIFVTDDRPVLLEDPVYHGLLRVFGRAGANVVPVAVTGAGLDVTLLDALALQQRPRLLVVTPNFQNPTGATLTLEQRQRVLDIAARDHFAVVESDIYGELRYRGVPLPGLKQLDASGNVILLGSYSKVAFPGLRVGWVIAPRPVIVRLAEAKQASDLHSDQLSQAVLLRFAQSGELARHLEQTRIEGAERLDALIDGCARYLPRGTKFTQPEGGMNLWVELPAPLRSESLLKIVEPQGVSFLPGSYFSSRQTHAGGLRLSFGNLSPEAILRGVRILGEAAAEMLAVRSKNAPLEPLAALV